MSDFHEKLKRLALPSWMDKGEPAKLLAALRRFWTMIYGWLTWPLAQLDAETCTEALLNLLAYQRDIQRFNGEPLDLYRKRVKYAFINAKDSGSVAGFIAIFERLGIGKVLIKERQPHIDWDVIILVLSDEQLSRSPDLLINIIYQYGRTCRRYQFEVINDYSLAMRAGSIEGDYISYHAKLPDPVLTLRVGEIASDIQISYASLQGSSAPHMTYGASLKG